MIAYDGQTYSGNSTFTYLNVNAASGGANAPSTVPCNFVFAQEFVQILEQTFPGIGLVRVLEDHLSDLFASTDFFNQAHWSGVVGPAHPAADATIDMLALFGLHAADPGHFVF